MSREKTLPYREWAALVKDLHVVDVRAPVEFAEGHRPGAISLPLFTDEERAQVGTTYKQLGPQQALLEGLEYVGPKMSTLLKKGIHISRHGKLGLYCSRGGQRSESMAWLFNQGGIEVIRLEGGYKAYRKVVLEGCARPLPYLVLGGPTGSGKTDILHILERMGEQVLDLEGMASHRGSAFGALGKEDQPSTAQFENNLYEKLLSFDPNKRVWVESESMGIGRVFMPKTFWDVFSKAPMINIDLPRSVRVDRLVEEYGHFSINDLKSSFQKIKKRLGGQHLTAAIAALEQGDMATAADIALNYYDKGYQRSSAQRPATERHEIVFKVNDPSTSASQLIQYANQYYPQ